VAGALDEVRETLDAGEIVVKAKSTMTLTVDLSGFEHDLATLRYSGRLVAKAFARLQRAGAVTSIAYSPHAFVHPAGMRLMVYRTDAFVRTFNSGDFAGRAERLRRWATGRGLQVAGVSSLGTGLPLSDDDGGPQEGTRP
jgi:GH24 family phage-related lysozyme (muramidase)